MKGLVFAVLADWAEHSISRDAAISATAALDMKEVSTIGVKLVRMRVAVPKTSKFENDSIKRKETPFWGGGVMTSCITDPSSSPIMVYRDKWLLTLSAKRTPLSASCSHPMLLEDREQAVDQGRWETLATVQDWLGCDTCSYTNHFGFVAASAAENCCSCKLHLPPQRAGIKFWDYGDDCVSGELSSEKLIDHEWKRFSDSIIIMQEFYPVLAHSPCLFALDRWEYSRDVRDRGDSSGTDGVYVGLLSPH